MYGSYGDGTVDPVVLELVGKGRELAATSGAALEVVLLGHATESLLAQLAHAGAATIRVVDDPRLASFSSSVFAAVIAELVQRHAPQVLLLGADAPSASLASRVAARLGTGLSAHCTDLKFERGQLVQTVPGFGGHVMANIVCPVRRPQMATVTAGVFKPAAAPETARVVRESVPIPDTVRSARQVGRERRTATTALPITKADVVVAGGFGVGSKEGWAHIEELARVLHGSVGATRPAVDEGWARWDQMIGASGRIIAPKLYVAAGISGMMHHAVGIHGAQVIVAINSDQKAPIFALADYGIVGDVREVVPALIQQLTAAAGTAAAIKPPGHTRTVDEYKASLRRLRPNIYRKGKLIEDPVEDPCTRRTIEGHGQIFEAARDPRYQDLLTTISHLTGKRISRYLSIIRSPEDMFANSRMKRLMFQLTGTCTGGRCAGWNAMNAMWSTTWDIDHDRGTDYHQRLTTVADRRAGAGHHPCRRPDRSQGTAAAVAVKAGRPGHVPAGRQAA